MAFEGQTAIKVYSKPSDVVGCLYIASTYPYSRKIVSPGSGADEVDYFDLIWVERDGIISGPL